MARVTYGESITEYAGSIGGITYQKNRSGNIAKLRANPTVNPTALQAGYQTNMAYLVSFWPTLSQEDKGDWDAFAAAHDHTTPWGEIKTLNGYQWFLSCNLNRLLIDESVLSSPPAWVSYPAPDVFILETSSTYLRLYWASAWDPVTYWTVYVSLPLRQSSLKLRRSLFFLEFVQDNTSQTYHDITVKFAALANVTWATFYASADASLIVRIKQLAPSRGLTSSFTSAIVKIG